ncbi:pyocin knob domain-containing protein [uncultured Fusobacterium sp.]|uniref:pyocin knob domain-containing protein n=1 Tax=uncultured Fusobacterium sp. TaxID=159267 RepID=UPI0025DDAC48|nr:pyocin knob domain-containing protein [uncultured Fusobacterium sp.]
MAILTKFLKLLKPEKNDYVDVEKHLSENYDKIDTKMEELSNSNDEKLNKGAVSSEYDTAKKIEDKIKKIINEKWKINTKYIGDTNTSTDFNSITANGTYYSSKYNALYTNGFLGANQRAYQEFKLIVIGENNDGAPVLKSQLVITRDDNIYLRSCTSWQAPWTWSEWEKIARMSDLTWGNIGGKPSSFPPSSHTHDDRYYTEAEINEKFKNFCPYAVGDVYVTTSTTNPATRWTGTTWQKIEGRFLLGTSSGQASKLTGGSTSKTIAKANLPNIKIPIDSFNLTLQPHYHNEGHACWEDDPNAFGKDWTGGAGALAHREGTKTLRYRTSTAGGGSTSTVTPQTSSLGSGQALDITPSYYTTHIWLRTS